MSLLVDLGRHSARILTTSVNRIFAVYRLGEQLGDGGLTGSSGSRKQISMSDTGCLDLISECRNDVILSLYLLEGIRAELSI